ncbi:hypothetical protein [Salinisphaera sp. T31B1]|uniref:hypothetical protein n=1 Tax=Salinisphaera sp. T31B1 TaxID=727963 RepID=UPI003342A9DE
MDSVTLIYTYPDGRKKYWRGMVDHRRSEVVLEYSEATRRVRQTVIDQARLKKPTLELELEWRAQKKLRKGYVHLQVEQYDENDPDDSSASESSMPASASMARVLALVNADDCDADWFF